MHSSTPPARDPSALLARHQIQPSSSRQPISILHHEYSSDMPHSTRFPFADCRLLVFADHLVRTLGLDHWIRLLLKLGTPTRSSGILHLSDLMPRKDVQFPRFLELLRDHGNRRPRSSGNKRINHLSGENCAVERDLS